MQRYVCRMVTGADCNGNSTDERVGSFTRGQDGHETTDLFGRNDMTELIFWISMDALNTQYPVRNIDPESCRRRDWLNVGGQVWTLRLDHWGQVWTL
jgi:hypothetical protein